MGFLAGGFLITIFVFRILTGVVVIMTLGFLIPNFLTPVALEMNTVSVIGIAIRLMCGLEPSGIFLAEG